jgi:hypothetical protein
MQDCAARFFFGCILRYTITGPNKRAEGKIMGVQRGPTLRAQWLGQQLRELREEARLTLKGIAEYIQRDPSTVSRLESGLLPARVPEVLAYLDLCGIDDPQRRDSLKRLSQDVFQKGWWDGYAGDVAGTLVDYVWLESRARCILSFQAVVLPGLLQTRRYAETLMRADDPMAPDERIARWVELRMERQQTLTRDSPLDMNAVLDEAVLRRSVGGREVMRDQIAHLIHTTAQGNVRIQILPAETGAHASPSGTFQILQMDDPYPDVGYVETAAGGVCVEGPGVGQLAERYHRLRGAALAPQETLAFLSAVVKDLE